MPPRISTGRIPARGRRTLTPDCCHLPSVLLATGSPRGPSSRALCGITYASVSARPRPPLLCRCPPLTRDAAPVDSASYARSVREDTAELASYVLSDKKDKRNPSFLGRSALGSSSRASESSSQHAEPASGDLPRASDEIIAEVSEPPSPESHDQCSPDEGPSILSSMLKNSPPKTDDVPPLPPPPPPASISAFEENESQPRRPGSASSQQDRRSIHSASEITPLLQSTSRYSRPPDSPEMSDGDDLSDVESQKPRLPSHYNRHSGLRGSVEERLRRASDLLNPKTWDGRAIWRSAVVDPISCLPSVIVGLLLNILDALSYGKQRGDGPWGKTLAYQTRQA